MYGEDSKLYKHYPGHISSWCGTSQDSLVLRDGHLKHGLMPMK